MRAAAAILAFASLGWWVRDMFGKPVTWDIGITPEVLGLVGGLFIDADVMPPGPKSRCVLGEGGDRGGVWQEMLCYALELCRCFQDAQAAAAIGLVGRSVQETHRSILKQSRETILSEVRVRCVHSEVPDKTLFLYVAEGNSGPVQCNDSPSLHWARD